MTYEILKMTPLANGGSTPTPAALYNWMLVLGFLAGIALTLKHLFTKKPSHSELATKEEMQKELDRRALRSDLNEFKAEVRGDMSEIKALIGGAVSKVEDYAEKSYHARKAIHAQVNTIDKGLTECRTRQSEQEKQITKLEIRNG